MKTADFWEKQPADVYPLKLHVVSKLLFLASFSGQGRDLQEHLLRPCSTIATRCF